MGKGILFPGQGAQVVGMGADFAETFPEARDVYQQADDILRFSLSSLCFHGPQEDLNRTEHAQPAILVTSLAVLAVLREREGLQPSSCSFTAGLSLGEYTALVFAGSLRFEDAVRLVRRRGQLMQAASDSMPSTMTSVIGMSEEQVATLCDRARGDDVLQVANLNAPGQVVIAGDVEACARAEAIIEEEKLARAVRLQVAGAFHSERMRPAVEPFRTAWEGVEVAAPQVPFASNVTGDLVSDPARIQDLLVQQIVSPVRWMDSMQCALRSGVTQFDEVGPGRVLAGIMRKIDRQARVRSVHQASVLSG